MQEPEPAWGTRIVGSQDEPLHQPSFHLPHSHRERRGWVHPSVLLFWGCWQLRGGTGCPKGGMAPVGPTQS